LQSSFKIYNASAGSGKTFTLVKEYLKLLFAANNATHFKHILAITFTNKAAGEMKDRIIETLKLFSNEAILKTPNSMFKAISEELPIKHQSLHNKSKQILQQIIYNYAAFDISTIDGFTHKVIRTFAYDLKLPLNFEVELDTQLLLNEAVNSLISKAGTQLELTNTLVDFAIEKADDDKSWDISFDLNKIAKLLTNENDLPYLQTLNDKTLEDFKLLKTQLKDTVIKSTVFIVQQAEQALQLIEECGLQFDDFSSGYLPKYFEKLRVKNFTVNFGSKWQTTLINNETLYPKRVTKEIASIIDDIQPQLIKVFMTTKQGIHDYKFARAFYKNITPLSVLNTINKELNIIKSEQNKILISEFNSLIYNEIKNQPTPFIYERLGEKFRHYFIDEFQDTSNLQWQNLMPLIDNALSGELNSAMLVGDAKQAIYRWRGGEAEQFIGLYAKTSCPFQIEQEVIALDTNYRSAKSIIDFNNSFFDYLSQNAFNEDSHKILFSKAKQHSYIDSQGFVSLSFLDLEKDDNQHQIYGNKVLELIKSAQEDGYDLGDICILVREKKQGLALANFLNEASIDIISSDSLLLKNAPEILFINSLLSVLIKPQDMEAKITVLNFLAKKVEVNDTHAFFSKYIHAPLDTLFTELKAFNIRFNAVQFKQQTLYNSIEYIIRGFNLVSSSNAYIQFYLDVVFDYSQKKIADISGFLDYFETKKDTLSIVSPEGQDAIQILTVHKSKGLEFPVIIYPYANTNIYKDIEPKEWIGINSENYLGFTHTLLNYSKDFQEFNEQTNAIYNAHQNALELDSLNILYVALTRPSQQLHIISEKDMTSKGVVNNKSYAGLFINYLKEQELWSDSQLSYSFGERKVAKTKVAKANIILEEQPFISTSIKDHNIHIVTTSALFWDTKQGDAIEKGNLLHKLLGEIFTKNDIDFVLNDALKKGVIHNSQLIELKEVLTTIIEHPKLQTFFNDEDEVFNERELISANGDIYIPDKVIINKQKEAVIIDYKTGQENNTHFKQLQIYQDLLETMNYKITKKILVYINTTITIKEL